MEGLLSLQSMFEEAQRMALAAEASKVCDRIARCRRHERLKQREWHVLEQRRFHLALWRTQDRWQAKKQR
jgi:hypothetical protein